jgi:F0F1-type ATP synthase assembly protein I
MPLPDDPNAEAPSLDRRIAAAEAAQAKSASGSSHVAMAQGYRFLGEVVGGVFLGAALGWLVDNFVTHKPPFGLIIGLFGGAGLSIFAAVRTASRLQKEALAKAGPLPSVPDDEDED